MRKPATDYMLVVFGLLLLGSGLFLVKSIADPIGIMAAFPYVCIGIGCGIFGHGMGNIISRKALKNNPQMQKQIEIEKNDERNLAISYKAKAKAYNMMVFVFAALMLSFALMGTDMVTVLLFAFAYLVVIGCEVYYLSRYSKEM